MGDEAGGEIRPVLHAHWVSIREAARLLAISEVAVRKQLAARSLTGLRAGHGWRVLLPMDPASRHSETGRNAVTAAEGGAANISDQTAEDLISLVRDLQQQLMTLAGQVGYLQSQLLQAQEQVKLVEEQRKETASKTRRSWRDRLWGR